MPGFGETLTEEERWHILNFLRETFGDFQREFTPVRPEDSAPGQVTK